MKKTFQIQTIPIDESLPFKDQLASLFREGEGLKVNTYSERRAELEWSKMYDAPSMGPKLLFTLCSLFGTEYVDVDGFAYSGCETCDYGSSYGHTFEIKDITENWDALKELDGQDLFKKQP